MNNEKFSLIGVAAEIREGFCMARDMSGEMSLQRIFITEILSSDARFITIKNGRRAEQ